MLDDDGARDLRVVGGREEDEPRGVDVRDAGLGGAGLAGDLDARDLRPRVPVPPVTTACIIWFSVAAVLGFIACFQTCGCVRVTSAAARAAHLLDEVRRP